jgi:capsular polysaccharide biosynthesis protein
MKQRVVDILFRYKLVILLPLLVIVPLATMVALRPKPAKWQSFAVIWVDQYRPLYQDDRLSYTPANSQAQLLNDFVHTHGFALNVAKATTLQSQIHDPESENRAVTQIWQAVTAWPESNDFVTVQVTMPTAELAYETARAVVAQFQDVLRQRMDEQSKVALQLYSDALTKAAARVQNSRDELAKYLAAHPELANRRPDSGILIESQDATLGRLSLQLSNDQDAYKSAADRYDSLNTTVAAGIQGQQLAFRVVDEPRMPLAPLGHSRLGMVVLPAFGLVMGLMLSGAVAVVVVITNRAVHGAPDVRGLLDLPVLAEVPELRRKRWPWQRAPRHAVRLRVVSPARSRAAETHAAERASSLSQEEPRDAAPDARGTRPRDSGRRCPPGGSEPCRARPAHRGAGGSLEERGFRGACQHGPPHMYPLRMGARSRRSGTDDGRHKRGRG